MKLPNPNRAIVDEKKLRDYCLSPTHRHGKHKARLFASAMGLTANDSDTLRNVLLKAAQDRDFVWSHAIRYNRGMNERPIQELDVVALTEDLPDQKLVRGQVGTVVFVYGSDAIEVEFVDTDGHTYGLTTLMASQLRPLHYEPIAA
jgi:hypothetical protein